MTEHVETACPRCGEAAADFRFCPSCGLNLGSMSEAPAQQLQVGDASQPPAYEPLRAPTLAGLSAADTNGASEHTAPEAPRTAASELWFDRFENTAVEANGETHEMSQDPPAAEWEDGDPSQQPAFELPQAPTLAGLSAADVQGAGEHTAAEASHTAVSELWFDRFEDTAVEVNTEPQAVIEESARAEWEGGDPIHQPAYEPLQPPAFVPVSAADSNGAGEHSVDETSEVAVPEIGFDRFEDTAVEVNTEPHEVLEEPARAEWEGGDPSHQPAYEPLQPPAFVRVSAADSNGGGEHSADETSEAAVPEIGFDRFEDAAVEANTETHEVFEEPVRAEWETGDLSQQPASEPLQPPAPAWVAGLDSDGASEHATDETSAAARSEVGADRSTEEEHGSTRSTGTQRVAFACLAAVIALLVLMASRSLRGRG